MKIHAKICLLVAISRSTYLEEVRKAFTILFTAIEQEFVSKKRKI